ncbi:nitrous oxide reductase family maturation protein NosD [Algoriphagus halophilus]|uniref:Nitrous oxidase accessory protein n=1 Tax=Algoriphagus halophilus TaxID=226505 RepID=A0A1N6EFX9_9BACT|nr:nitrous oxide reductase family maturation protein NosD [Algoriphagus halophilus]SIN81914.1 nitrous oxidase accessory protein [Algoriphagus halophilus]
MVHRIYFLILLIYLFSNAQAKTLNVCEQCQFKELITAIEQAQKGDTVLVKAGIYPSKAISITKSIVLIGEKGAILDGMADSYVLKLLADSITVSGFDLRNSGRSYTKDYAAIYTFGIADFQILNNQISESFFGILIEKSKNGLIQGNKVKGVAVQEDQSGNGIHLWHAQQVQVLKNEVSGMRDGIYLEFVDESRIAENYTHQNVRYGLHFMFSNHDEYLENVFQNNGAGVAVMFSKWIRMEANQFIDNWGTASYGLLLKEIYDGEVLNNTFQENTLGVYVDGSTRVNYIGNTFKQNGWAIKVSGGCYANKFSRNNFHGNSFDLSYNSKMNDNSFDGNFWGSYSGYDLDKDGVGDQPYRPVKLFSYIVNQTPETIVLLRSLFIDLINFSEKVSPSFTPDDLVDHSPSMKQFQ